MRIAESLRRKFRSLNTDARGADVVEIFQTVLILQKLTAGTEIFARACQYVTNHLFLLHDGQRQTRDHMIHFAQVHCFEYGGHRRGTSVVNLPDGLLGLEEGDQVMDMFARNRGVRVIRVDAEQEFLGSLARMLSR